jgi:hypothetical protein
MNPIPVVLLVVEGGPNTVRTGMKCQLVFFFKMKLKVFVV